MFVYGMNDQFNFGKYNGKTLKEVLLISTVYIEYCIKNTASFCISEETLSEIKLEYPKITFSNAALNMNSAKLRIHKKDKYALFKIRRRNQNNVHERLSSNQRDENNSESQIAADLL